MKLKGKLRKMFTGLSLFQEYLCLDQQTFTNSLSVYATFQDSRELVDVSRYQLFLGYKPLVIGLFFKKNNPLLGNKDAVCLSFQQHDFQGDTTWRGFSADKKSIARLLLKRNQLLALGDYMLILYEGAYGQHTFLHSAHQLVNSIREKFTRRQLGNVSLENNLYDQVRIAYAIPRDISVITVSDGNGNMNMFPTDLHGTIDGKYYAGSLRIGGKANRQVENYQRIVIAQVSPSFFKETYALGKNHMMELRDEKEFNIQPGRSKTFGYPLPIAAQQYHELQWFKSVDIGIHRIHLYEVVHVETKSTTSTLSHIHIYYGQWRHDHRLTTEILTR